VRQTNFPFAGVIRLLETRIKKSPRVKIGLFFGEPALRFAFYDSTEKSPKTDYLTALFGRKRTLFQPKPPFFRRVVLRF
jgi:hypothetical protein